MRAKSVDVPVPPIACASANPQLNTAEIAAQFEGVRPSQVQAALNRDGAAVRRLLLRQQIPIASRALA